MLKTRKIRYKISEGKYYSFTDAAESALKKEAMVFIGTFGFILGGALLGLAFLGTIFSDPK